MTLKKNIRVSSSAGLPSISPIPLHDGSACQSTAVLYPAEEIEKPRLFTPRGTTSVPDFPTGPTQTLIPASHGFASPVKAGTHFRLIDLHGSQVIDMTAFVLPSATPTSLAAADNHPNNSSAPVGPSGIASAEHLSASYTRFHSSGQPLAADEYIYTNMDRPLFRLVSDKCFTHDMTFMSCFPHLYTAKGIRHHRSCTENMVEAFARFGMRSLTEVRDPFNVFQNTPNYTLKALNTSRRGDWIEFEVLLDCVVGWSCCPYDLDGFNGGRVTDVMAVTGLRPGRGKGGRSDYLMDERTEAMVYGMEEY